MSVYTTTRKLDPQKTPAKAAERNFTYGEIGSFLQHLDAWGLRLVSLAVAPDGTATITTDGPVPDDQLGHLELVLVSK